MTQIGIQITVGGSVVSVLLDIGLLFLVLLGPFIAFALIIHFLEKTIQLRLAERFGWKSVMWTGWLGTPIHELSHAIMCKVFNHRIDELVLFEPDKRSGRLGYVHHSYKRDNWFQVVGNVFIGIAPLIGGSLALMFLLWLFFPDAAQAAFETATSASQQDVLGNPGSDFTESRSPDAGVVGQTIEMARLILGNIFLPANLFSWRLWVFLYLVLCISSHMAPSPSDYAGTTKGALLLGIVALAVALILATTVEDLVSFSLAFAKVLSPLFAIMLLSLMLCCLSTVLVSFAVQLFPKRFVVR